MIWRYRYVHCAPACTSLVAVRLQYADNKTRDTYEGWALEAVTVRDAAASLSTAATMRRSNHRERRCNTSRGGFDMRSWA